MIPSCFSQPNTVSSTTSQKTHPPPPPSQALISSNIYQTQLCNLLIYLTLTWSKSLCSSSRSLTIFSPHSFSITISLNPLTTFSFFKTRPQSRSFHLTHHHKRQKLKLHWDFTKANFTKNSAKPESNYYIAISSDNSKLEFFLGDLIITEQILKPLLLSQREHMFGERNYLCRADFLGSKCDIEIECDGGVLKLKVDGEISLVVKRLWWKFRGNEKIVVGGFEVEFFWDVFDWVNDDSSINGGGGGYGVFVFQVGQGVVVTRPAVVGAEKKLMKKISLRSPSTSPVIFPVMRMSLPAWSSSVLQWAEESVSLGGRRRSSCSSSTSTISTRSCKSSNEGFSLMLYAWKKGSKF